MNTQQIQLTSYPDGRPRPDNFKVAEQQIEPIADGEILVQNEWLSVDPYMRGRMRQGKSYVPPFELNAPLEGGCIGKVVESSNDRFSIGDHVLANHGWRTGWKSNGQDAQKIDPSDVPTQAYLSVLGMTGLTAYVGLLKIGQLKAGTDVFVSAASGAVGSIVCQIAKLHDCRVVGSAGSAKKIQWLQETAGVDEAFNYHDIDDVSAKLTELCPDGIDVYFDNVGGDHLQGAIDVMNDFGRIVACGMISTYNDETPQPGPNNLFKIIGKQLRMEGFIVRDHFDVQNEFRERMTEWIQAGEMQWEETITEGIENASTAFIDLFDGDKMGKSLVKVS
jgi:NADPH-dependent curcumin reductase CurA